MFLSVKAAKNPPKIRARRPQRTEGKHLKRRVINRSQKQQNGGRQNTKIRLKKEAKKQRKKRAKRAVKIAKFTHKN